MKNNKKWKILITSGVLGLGCLGALGMAAPAMSSLHTPRVQPAAVVSYNAHNAAVTTEANGLAQRTAYYGKYVVAADDTKVYPPQLDDSDLGAEITTKELTDAGLYQRLLVIYKSYYGSLPAGKSTLRRDMFKGVDFSTLDGTLNLSGAKIVELYGLELLNFDDCIGLGLSTINLANNELAQVDAAQLDSIKNIPSINLSNNKLTAVDLTRMEKLSKVDLGNNYLSSVDLSKVKADTSDATIILNNNSISDLNQISLRRSELLTNNINLYAIGNPLTNIDVNNSKVRVQVGMLGLSGTSTKILGDSGTLTYNQITNLDMLGLRQEIQLVIVKDSDLTEVAVINNAESSEAVNLLSRLSYGKYQAYYRYVDGTSAYADNHTFVDIDHSPYVISIVPSAPTFVICDRNGNEIEFANNTPITQDITVKLSTTATGGEIYYRFNSNEWVKATDINIDANQSGTMSFKVVINGIESEEGYINFAMSRGFGWTEIIIILSVAIGFLLIFFVAKPIAQYFINRPLVIDKKKNDDENI